jgi:hypothetical protein
MNTIDEILAAALKEAASAGPSAATMPEARGWTERDIEIVVFAAKKVVAQKLEAMAGPMGSALGKHIASKLGPLEKRIEALEGAHMKSLADSFQGPWLPRALYKRGALVQHAGAVWIALEDVDGKPGESAGWRLMVKAAR